MPLDSPLAELTVVDIDAVFRKDPKAITREERRALIARLRDDRARWLDKQEERAAKKEAKEDAEAEE